jgi:cytochrome c-type biogenesis protein CcmF
VGIVTGVVLPLAMGQWTPLTGLGLMLAGWVATAGIVQIRERLKSGPPPRAFWGMQSAHFGIAVFVVGITMVGGYQTERDVRMAPGDTTEVGGYVFRFLDVRQESGPNYETSIGDVEVTQGGRLVTNLHPEKRNYHSSAMPMTEAAIHTGFTGDLYVSLGEPLDGGAWAVRVYHKPFVKFIWFGCLMMAFGGLLAASDRRYRLTAKSSSRLVAQGAQP